MRVRDGYLVIGHFGRAPIRIHWTMPLGAFVLCGLRFAPGAWLGFLILVLVHELGHALLARAVGGYVASVDVHAVGGSCEWGGDVTMKQRAIVAWGGVLAQLAVLLTAPVWSSVLPSGGFFGEITTALTTTNLMLIALNLIPAPPFDGAEAWRLFRR
ncbi:hypothetical protein [Polyangium sp. 15x6]|uniref:hypothetical protein n=1 Tax=Polyangium sp. 15x6 TaxID=3042687 RepID=UPI002499E896|nr:hypothetical protein [Polyangium sp. 15x6]MDI3288474.1 hypothetical protein [Polyangium sp. 15x6]